MRYGGPLRVMKYFWHILMSHEIFFKIFDGPQSIFLCSIFALLFFKLRGLQHKIFKLMIKGDLRKTRQRKMPDAF